MGVSSGPDGIHTHGPAIGDILTRADMIDDKLAGCLPLTAMAMTVLMPKCCQCAVRSYAQCNLRTAEGHFA